MKLFVWSLSVLYGGWRSDRRLVLVEKYIHTVQIIFEAYFVFPVVGDITYSETNIGPNIYTVGSFKFQTLASCENI